MARAARQIAASNGDVQWVRLRNFMRGYSPRAVLPGEALQFLNVRIDREFKVVPRAGTAIATADLGTLGQGIMLYPAPGIGALFVYDGKVAHATGDAPWTPTVLETNTGISVLAQMFRYGTYVIIVGITTTSGGTPRKYNGSTVTDLGGSPPSALMGALWADRLWTAGSASKRLYYSDAANPESWPALNWMDVGDTADYIQALVPSGDALYIVKQSSIWQLTGRTSSDFYLRPLIDKIGIYSTQNIRAFESIGGASITVLSDGRLWAKTGDMTEMSDQVYPIGADYSAAPMQMMWDMASQRLLLSVPTSASAGYTLAYDAMRKGWYKWSLPAACFGYHSGVTYMGLRTGQFIYLDDSLSTDYTGSPFTCTVQEQFTPFAAPLLEKYLRHLYVDGTCYTGAGTVTVDYRMSPGGAYSTITRTGLTFPCVLNYSKKRFAEMSITVSVSNPSGFTYEGVDVGYIPARRKRE